MGLGGTHGLIFVAIVIEMDLSDYTVRCILCLANNNLSQEKAVLKSMESDSPGCSFFSAILQVY